MEYSNENQQLTDLFDLKIDVKAEEQLRVALQWARIVAIIAFISLGLSFVELIINGMGNVAALIGGMLFTLIVAAISILIYLFLYKFAQNMKAGLDAKNQELVSIAFSNLKTHFKIMGIILIIGLSLCVLFFFAFLLGGGL